MERGKMYTNDQRLFYGDNGKGVVLIHGITAGCAEMQPLGRLLNDYGYSVHCVNIAGHGTYPGELLRTSWEDAVDKAWYDYDRMKQYYEKVYIGGLSMGGCLSLALASRRDDVDGIFSFSAPLRLVPGSYVAGDYPEDQVYYHRPMAGKQGVARRYHIHYEDVAIHAFHELKGLMSWLNEDGVLERIHCPAFVAQALDDDVAEPSSAEEIFGRISSENKYLFTAPSGGHLMCMTEGRLDLMKAMIPWLDKMDGILH